MNIDSAILIAAATAFFAGLVRGFSGFGAGLIFIPMAGAWLDPPVATATLLVTDGVLTIPNVVRALGRCHWRSVAPVSLAAVTMIPLGAWLLVTLPSVPVRWAITGIALALVCLIASGWRYRGEPTMAASVATGAVSGVLSGLAQLAGPPVIAFWLARPFEPAVIRANIFVFFGITTVMAMISYAGAGLLTQSLIPVLIMVMPAYGVGLLIGSRLFGGASEQTYRVATFSLIGLAVILSLPLLDPLLR